MKLIYLFDPLCGWCYASSQAVQNLATTFEVSVFATGLFADTGRKMTPAFAQHAWANDQRIAQLTGQPFSETYHQQILQGCGEFNSRALSNACFALLAQGSETMLQVFAELQKARYVDGQDTSQTAVVRQLLQNLGQSAVAESFDLAENQAKTTAWIEQGQAISAQFGVQGVPNLFAETEQGWVNVPSQLLYQNAESAVENLKNWLDRL
ncbi:DsbA family protein [Mannheimia bovis]|uniref:DsbA family protein n=1 Tax=Mannheimia bovis TaxID=2770636 RepID=A0A7H1C5A6_9PAST|nr:DsbA family protein [Mannheimia bovis]QNS16161.1 DsbA family protein [Mannheimia bovis]